MRTSPVATTVNDADCVGVAEIELGGVALAVADPSWTGAAVPQPVTIAAHTAANATS
jgi:hypothetical protein